ncbi:MAG: packaged DNA stabilization gp4 family protein [Acinetobacter sp.]
MSWTKREFVEQALEELGLASYVFDLQPEQMNSARIKLDAMIAGWAGRGLKLNYPLTKDSDLDEETGVPDAANEAIYKNLAIALAPSYGKAITIDTRASAKDAYDSLVRLLVSVPQMRLPTNMPIGAGNKDWCQTFVAPVQNNNVDSPSGALEFNNAK